MAQWWIQKNGHVEGPYSDDDMRKRISFNLVSSLDRVSEDSATWKFVRDTPLWKTEPQAKPRRLTSTFTHQGGSGRPEPPPPASRPAVRLQSGGGPLPQRPAVASKNTQAAREDSLPDKITHWYFNWKAIAGVLAFLAAVIGVVDHGLERNKGRREKASLNKLAKKVVPKVCSVLYGGEVGGSAFLLNQNGRTYVVSTEDVFRTVDKPDVLIGGNRPIQLGAFSVAPDANLARFEAIDSDACALSTGTPELGAEIFVFGESKGVGIAQSKAVMKNDPRSGLFEIDADITHLTRGGPIVDKKGNVVGVACLIDPAAEGGGEGKSALALTLDNVRWMPVDRVAYLDQVSKLAELKLFWDFLRPFVSWEQSEEAREDARKMLRVVDEKVYGERDDYGFHERMTALKGACSGFEKARKQCRTAMTETSQEQARDAYRKFTNERRRAIETALSLSEKEVPEAMSFLLRRDFNYYHDSLRDWKCAIENVEKNLDDNFEEFVK